MIVARKVVTGMAESISNLSLDLQSVAHWLTF